MAEERYLHWEEIRTLAVARGAVQMKKLNLTLGMDRGELVSFCFNSKLPMKVSDCNDEQLRALLTLDDAKRQSIYGNPPTYTPWVGGHEALIAAVAEKKAAEEKEKAAANPPLYGRKKK